jgi:putative ABC transport system permease protein
MTALLHDLRSAVRLFQRDWRFSVTLVVTLATGIAATAIVFNVLNNTLLRPLPIPDERRVYRLLDWTRGPDGQPLRRSTRVHNFLAIRDHARSFESVVALRAINFALDGGEAPIQVYVGLISSGAFELLGVRPVLGRVFTSSEEADGVDAGVIVLSHSLWQQQLGGRPDAVGSTLRLDGRPHTVVGVLGPGFRFPYDVDAWIPERIAPHVEASVATIARLAPGVTSEQAAQELDAIAAAVERERPDTNRGMRYFMQPLREQLIGNQAQVTWSLLATAVLLLGLSCANVANLLLARGTRRTREMAVQSAIGASHGRQMQQLIAESLVYCAAGTVMGLILAALLGDSVMSLVPLPLRTQLGLGSVSFDWRVALFASAATAVTAVLAGLVPARRLANTNPIDSLRQHGRGSTGPRMLMQSLVVGEVALASVLLMVSALMADNLSRLNTADLGLRASELSSIEITLPESRYAAAPDRIALVRAVTGAARSVAGVQQAAIVTVNPLDRGSFGAAIETEDRPLPPREPGHIINNRLVTDGWFEAAGVTLRRGRLFTAQDDERAPLVAVVSQRMADRFWPGDEAIGKRLRLARPGTPWLTVVGIVGDVRDFGDWRETWYLPYPQHASTLAATNLHLMLRSPLPPDVLGHAMQEALRTVDARLPVPIPTPMTDMWATGLEQQRLAAAASTLFGASGLLLAILGTYGVLAYAVSARAREFGIRLALGAERRDVLLDVLRRGALLAAVGLAAGVGAGALVNRALADVATETAGAPLHLMVAVVGALGASAMVASLVPALRATRIDPADVMRIES